MPITLEDFRNEPNGLYEKIKANLKDSKGTGKGLNYTQESKQDFIVEGFAWCYTPEGVMFWRDIAYSYEE